MTVEAREKVPRRAAVGRGKCMVMVFVVGGGAWWCEVIVWWWIFELLCCIKVDRDVRLRWMGVIWYEGEERGKKRG